VSDRLMLNAPYEIVYNSTIDFEPGTAVPSLDELNSQLQTAFTGDTKALYLSMLVELGPDNIFCKLSVANETAATMVRVGTTLTHSPLLFATIPAQTTDVVFTFFETNADAANGQSTSSTDMSSPLVLAAIGAGTLALIVAAAATIHFFKHRGDSSPGAKLPPPDYATHAAESTTGAADYPQHGGSTATGDTHSCMSPTSNASHTDETEPASGGTNHRNPRVYRLSRQAIGSSGMHLPSHRDGTNACIGPMQQSLSFEGDDDDNDERWMNLCDNHHSSSTQGEAIPSTSESDESCERRRNHRVDQVPMPLLY
jgi:hypothetical protein